MLARVLSLQISYFADPDAFNGLLQHLGRETPWAEVFETIRDGFGEENPRRPFVLWQWDESDGKDWERFKSLVTGLTRFDPRTRLTAMQALEHDWFRDC